MEKRRLPTGYIALGVVCLVLIGWLTARYLVKRKLLRSLGTNDMAVREEAVRTLLDMEKLVDSLPAQPIINRSKTAEALGEIGSEEAIRALGVILRDQEDAPRRWARRALEKQGDRATPTLMAALGSGGDAADQAVEALAEIGEHTSARVRFLLTDRSAYGAAAEALVGAGGVGIPALVDACYSGDDKLRAQGLGKLGGEGLSVGVEPALYNLQPDWSQGDAIKALGLIGDRTVVPDIIPFLEDKGKREAAVTALGQIGDARAVQPILATMTESEKRYRNAAILALRRIGPEAFPALVRDLRSVHQLKRRAAADALVGSSSSAVTQPLVAALGDSDREVRASAALGLGWKGNLAAIAPLIAALYDADWRVVDAAVEALSAVGVDALDRLLVALGDPSHSRTAHYQMARALGAMGTPAVPGLIAALPAARPDVQTWTVIALGDIGDQRAADALRELRRTASSDLKWVIDEQLRSLSRVAGS
jgi:HEAT repeat protein